jgi:predicted regulator of Ras-like GTPase activity (Roadblock/LC7/MglB family)
MIDVIEIDERIAKCERILETNPQSQIFAALAEAYRKKGDITKAQEICAQGLLIHPDYPSARIVMAKIFITKGNYELAREELNKAILGTGRTRAIDVLEAEILIKTDQKAEAAILLQSLAASDPNDENVKGLLLLLHGNEQHTPETPKSDTSKLKEPIAIKFVPPPPPEKKDHPKDLPLSRAISILKIMPRVLGVVAVSQNGLLLDGRFDSQNSKEEFAALSKGIFDTANSCSGKVGMGKVSELLLETHSSKLWLFDKGKFILVVFTRDDASMGALKLKIEELFEKIEC